MLTTNLIVTITLTECLLTISLKVLTESLVSSIDINIYEDLKTGVARS